MTSAPGYRRYVLGVLLLAYVLNQVDRAVFGILMEPIRQEFGLSDTQMGFLAGPALAVMYATLGVPVARWGDRSHRVNIMAGAIALWSGIVMLTAATGRFWQLALTRIGVGVGEAGFSALAQSVLADYFDARERPRALSIFLLGIPLGAVVSSVMGGWINEVWGWRTAFLAAGAPGLILAVLLKLTVREPPRRTDGSQTPEDASLPLRTVMASLWRRPELRRLAIAMTLLNLIGGGVLGWQSVFFIRLHGMSTAELGLWLAVNAGAGGALGIALGGWIGRAAGPRPQRSQARRLAISAFLSFGVLLGLLLVPDRHAALGFAFLAAAMTSFFYAPAFALVSELSAARARATTLSIVMFAQLIAAGVVGLQVTGLLSDALAPAFGSHSVRWAMLAMTPFALWAGLAFWRAGETLDGTGE